jgi:hypothetical protein
VKAAGSRRRADAGAGQHGHDHFGDHRQVNADDIALGYPLRLQGVGEPLHVPEELGIGQVAFLMLRAPPVERDPAAMAGQHVPVKAVVGRVDGPVGEPRVERRVGVVEDRAERRVPVQALARLRRPPCRGVGRRLLVHVGVGHHGAAGKAGRRRELLQPQQFPEAVGERRRLAGIHAPLLGSVSQGREASARAALSAGREFR